MDVLGNTKKNKVRCWKFTWHDAPTRDEVVKLLCDGTYIFQLESCPTTGRIHIEGAVKWKNARHFTAMKKLLPGAHLEPARSWAGCVAYCSKYYTSLEGYYTNIDPKTLEKKSYFQNQYTTRIGRPNYRWYDRDRLHHHDIYSQEWIITNPVDVEIDSIGNTLRLRIGVMSTKDIQVRNNFPLDIDFESLMKQLNE